MRLPQFDYHCPENLEQFLKIKADMGQSAVILAGGTDLLVNLKHRLTSPNALVSLRNIDQLRGIEVRPTSLVIKAGTSLYDVANHEAVANHFPILVQAARSVGAAGIQHHRGTIGGNLCLSPRCIMYNQSLFWRTGKGKCHRTGGNDCLALPRSESCQAVCSGDTVPVLAALSAQLTMASLGGTRSLPIGEFFSGKGESPLNIAPEEILTEIRLPVPWSPLSWAYKRIAARAAVDFPLVSAAAAAIVDRGKVESFRLVLGACGPAPIVLRELETSVKGQTPVQEMARLAGENALRAAEGAMIENTSASKDYRIKMAAVVARRAALEALGLGTLSP